MAEFFFEIGFEEMPAPWLSGLADQLKAKFTALATAEQIAPADVRVLWTSRRLVLVADVKARQDDRTVVEWGPAAKIAKDASGNWSKAAEGFAKKQGMALDALKLAPKVDGSPDLYVSATKAIAGRPTSEVLAGLLPAILRGFNFPKRMNWDAWLEDGRGAFEFGRPIQWIVALLAGEVVPLTIHDAVAGAKGAPRVVSGRCSMGNRFYPRGASDRGFDVRSFSELEAGLASRFVILRREDRVSMIRSALEQLRGSLEMRSGVGAARQLTESEWPDLVEFPQVAIGRIPEKFRNLPIDVMATVLLSHQKALALGEPGSKVVSAFAVITGCDAAGARNAVQGQERVVIARLKDAHFFYEEDDKRSLETRIPDLGAITFHRGLGSYLEKANRISSNAASVMVASGARADLVSDARSAGLLAKADLGTLMVREFPELQGTMGGIYLEGKVSVPLARAVRWHYQPVGLETDSFSAARLTADERTVFGAVSLADKIDTLVGYIGLGVLPTGSSDPFGLRRAAQGVIRVLLEFWPSAPPDIDSLLNEAVDRYGQYLTGPRAETIQSVKRLLLERLRAVLLTKPYGTPELIDAVFGARRAVGQTLQEIDPLGDIPDTDRRLRALFEVSREQPDVFATVGALFKRAKNVAGEPRLLVGSFSAGVPGHDQDFTHVNQNLLEHPAEIALSKALFEIREDPRVDPIGRLKQIAGVSSRVAAFFDSVLVNDERQDVQRNRKSLLQILLVLVYLIADLSKLAAPAGENAASS